MFRVKDSTGTCIARKDSEDNGMETRITLEMNPIARLAADPKIARRTAEQRSEVDKEMIFSRWMIRVDEDGRWEGSFRLLRYNPLISIESGDVSRSGANRRDIQEFLPSSRSKTTPPMLRI